MISLLSGNSYLWQWNTGQRVILDDAETATAVSFSVDQVTAIRREVCDSGGEKYAEIPNILLQTAGMLYVYVHHMDEDRFTTVLEAAYPIHSQPKLSDYIEDDDEILVWHQLDERLTRLEEAGGGSGEDGGYYIPSVIQADSDHMTLSYKPSKAGMPPVESVQITLPKGSGGVDPEQPVVKIHKVTLALTNVSSDNPAQTVKDGEPYTAKLTADNGYILDAPVIIMGGGNITSSAWTENTATIRIPSVTGELSISCNGIREGTLDTTVVVTQWGVQTKRDSDGGVIPNEYSGVTKVYPAKNISDSDTVIYCTPVSTWGNETYPTVQLYKGNTPVTFWSQGFGDLGDLTHESSTPVTNQYGECDSLRMTVYKDHVDDSYAFMKNSGKVLFAGKNTKYCGMDNVNSVPVKKQSVASAVDSQYLMRTLTEPSTIKPSDYPGLSTEYISMVQTNYDAMMSETLGDYDRIPFVLHTDQHGRIGAANSVMKLIGNLTNWYEISACINLGDTCVDYFVDSQLKAYNKAVKDYIPMSKRIEVYGNHDTWDKSVEPSKAIDPRRLSPYFKNLFGHRYGNNGFITLYDDNYNVKYVIISNLEHPENTYHVNRILSDQADAIIQELSKDDGYDIILLSHIPWDSDGVTSRDPTYAPYKELFMPASSGFMEMLAARKQCSGSGVFTDSLGGSHPYDFSGVKTKLLVSLHGHAHFEAYRTFANSITEFIFDWFDGNTFYWGYVDRAAMKLKVWKNEIGVEALEINLT